MESVFFLLDTFAKQSISLNDLNVRCDQLLKMVNDFLTTLYYSKSSAKQKSRQFVLSKITGGGTFDLNGILTFDQNLTQIENVLNVIYQIETVWPYIKSKVDLQIKSLKSCQTQVLTCQKLADPLRKTLQSDTQNRKVDKITLIAFNSDMAQLDARVSILIYISQSLFEDMKDLNDIATYIQKLATDEDVKDIIKLLYDSSKSLKDLSNEINEISKKCMGAPLINPRFLEATTHKNDITFNAIDSSVRAINSLNEIKNT